MAELTPQEQLNKAKVEAEEIKGVAAGIAQAIQSAITNAGQLAIQLGISSSNSRNIEESARKLIGIQKEDLADKSKVRQIQKDARALQVKISLGQSEINRLYKSADSLTAQQKDKLQDILEQKVEEVETLKELAALYGDVLNSTKQISKEAQYFDKAAEFLNRIPIIGPTLSKPFKDISTALKEAKLEGADPLVAGFNAASKSIATLSLGFFIQQGIKASSQVTDLQKALLLSKDEAYALRQEFIGVAAASGDTFITTDKLLASNAALSQQLGFSKRFSDDLNIGFTNLTKRIGLSEEAAGGLAKASIITGRSMKSIQDDASGAVSAISAQYGIQLSVKDVLERAGKSSSLLLANFKGNIPALAEGIAKMDALGTSLETTQKQANKLLDWQSSIQDTLEANLITGRYINLDKARELALNNDLVGLSEELVSNQVDYNTFSQMNAIQRSSFAKALGLETQELSDQLLKLEYQKRSRTEIVALYGEEAAKRASSLSAQDKFNATIDKLSGLLGNLLDGPMGKLVDMMASLASKSWVVYGTLGLMAAMSFASVVSSIISLTAALSSAAVAGGALQAFLSPTKVVIGLIALAGVTSAIISAVASARSSASQPADDLMSGYGERTLITPNGSYALNNNDTVIAGTNLFRGNDVYSGPKDSINLGQSEFDYAKLAQAMSNIKLTAVSKPSEFAPFISKEQNKSLGVNI